MQKSLFKNCYLYVTSSIFMVFKIFSPAHLIPITPKRQRQTLGSDRQMQSLLSTLRVTDMGALGEATLRETGIWEEVEEKTENDRMGLMKGKHKEQNAHGKWEWQT
jgi:hypothetical protein